MMYMSLSMLIGMAAEVTLRYREYSITGSLNLMS